MPDDQPAPEGIAASPELSRRDAQSSKIGPKRPLWRRIRFWGKTAVAIFAGVPSAVIAAWLLLSLLVLTFHGSGSYNVLDSLVGAAGLEPATR